MKRYKAILLDLDGTLLDIEVSFFLGPMVEAMYGCFQDVLDMESFRRGLFGGTEAIMAEPRNDGETNLEGFNRTFSSLTGMAVEQIDRRFGRFYEEVFPTLSRFGKPMKGAADFITGAIRDKYILCLATNPIFPMAAVLERLRWSGIMPEIFSFIPWMENMSSCKPQAEYYLSLASGMKVTPSECLMVGNDARQDLPASKVGMGTFLVDGKKGADEIQDIEPDARGSLEDLGRMLGLE